MTRRTATVVACAVTLLGCGDAPHDPVTLETPLETLSADALGPVGMLVEDPFVAALLDGFHDPGSAQGVRSRLGDVSAAVAAADVTTVRRGLRSTRIALADGDPDDRVSRAALGLMLRRAEDLLDPRSAGDIVR